MKRNTELFIALVYNAYGAKIRIGIRYLFMIQATICVTIDFPFDSCRKKGGQWSTPLQAVNLISVLNRLNMYILLIPHQIPYEDIEKQGLVMFPVYNQDKAIPLILITQKFLDTLSPFTQSKPQSGVRIRVEGNFSFNKHMLFTHMNLMSLFLFLKPFKRLNLIPSDSNNTAPQRSWDTQLGNHYYHLPEGYIYEQTGGYY
ncbi:hypothetical protein EDC96DRAFT_599106 [Choanephora cucurbitarum]|nr:hypothetical protein EDC96DRAFT_599106 [Choanephora cucurbitarum]